MAENFNVPPYYDDFDPTKNYHRVLFKPGVAVQARELTQSQTILQNQISNFADNIFSQNTPVSGGKVTTNTNCYYIRLNSTYSGSSVTASAFLNKTISDKETGIVVAKVIATSEGVTGGDPPTLIVSYISGVRFADNATIYPTDGTQTFATVAPSTTLYASTGPSSVASVSSGVYYIVNGYNQSSTQNADGTYTKYSIGNFVQVNPQTIILNKYSAIPSYRIGLNITENLVTYADDASLLDPAVGASNYQAPGADRYQVNLTLTSLPLTVGSDSSFIELVRVVDGNIVKQADTTVYSAIDDYFAKRDYETNGDYVVEDFKFTPTPNAASDSTKYDMKISRGVAYVRGYRVENQSQITLTSDRAQTTTTESGKQVNLTYGNYVIVDNLSGEFNPQWQTSIDFHCVQQANIAYSTAISYQSTLVGTGNIRALKWSAASPAGSNTAAQQFYAYVSDFVANVATSNASSATSNTITFFDPTGKFSSAANAYAGITIQITSGTDFGDTRSIVSYNASTKTATVSPQFTVVPDTTSQFSLIFNLGDTNAITQTSGAFGSPSVISAKANINASNGKTPGVPSGTTNLYNPGQPEMIFKVGNPYVSSIPNTIYNTTFVYTNQSFSGGAMQITLPTGFNFAGTVGQTYGGDGNGATFKPLFTVINKSTGAILDFSNTGNTVTIASNTIANFSSSYYNNTSNLDVYAQVYANYNGENSSPILKTKTLVVGNTAYGASLTSVTSNTSLSLTSGQARIAANTVSANAFTFFVNDVKRVTKIIDLGSYSASPTGNALTSYTDMTTSFVFDNGQRDSHYDWATLKLLPGVTRPTGDILVCFDYYNHGSSGDGYFSVNSYTNESYAQIPFYTAKDGTTYPLRDCVDFRPCRASGTTSQFNNAYGGWEYSSAISSTPNSFGTMQPTDTSVLNFNYNYYLGRKDILVLSKDSNFSIIEGTPATVGKTLAPSLPNGSLLLANLVLDPYTAYLPGETPDGITANLSVNKVIHKRWAKSDITDLQTQVDNLEYYTALTALEAKAAQTQVPNAAGVTRPNYGILVDDFSNFGVADYNNQDFATNINIRTNRLTPITSVNNYQLQNPVVIQSLNTLNNVNSSYAVNSIGAGGTNIFTLPYTSANLAVQQLASNTISVNPFSVVVHQGYATLNPPMDNWVNTVEVPQILITDPSLQFNQQAGGINLTNAGDFASLPGTSTVIPSTSTSIGVLSGQNSTSKPLEQGGTGTSSAFIASPTQTYISQLQGLNNAEVSSSVSPALSTTNGVVTNTAVLPNIRMQEIIVRAGGMSINTPISAWFDGQNVSKYITTPNTIELTGVNGNFNQDDIIGFYENDITSFFPVARVVSVYNYPNSSNTRLYVATNIQVPNTINTTVLTNAFFDANGNYQGNTAGGQVVFANNSLHSIHTSGYVTGPGGGSFINSTAYPTANVFKSETVTGWSDFLNSYGIWGDQNNGATYTTANPANPFPFTVTANGTYTVTVCSASDVSGSISLDGSTIFSSATGTPITTNPKTTATTTVSLTVGSHTVGWSLTNFGVTQYYAGPSIAITVSDSTGNIIWNTLSPSNITYNGVSTVYQMPAGGAMYVGANQIQLDTNASTANGYYTGAVIDIKTMYTYNYNYGAIYYPPYPPFSGDSDGGRYSWYCYYANQYNTSVANALNTAKNQVITLQANMNYSANILSYNGVTRTVTLKAGELVNLSVGYNTQYGNITSSYSIKGIQGSFAAAIKNGTNVPQLSTDEHGQFVGIFNVPGSVFYAGQRIFRLDNRTTQTDPASATTYAESTFYAGGLVTNSQSLNYAPSVDASATSFTQTNLSGYNIVSQTPNIDPVAQTFIIDKNNYPNGVFLNSIKLFFGPFTGNVAPSSAVTLSIVGTLNGYPDGKTLNHSTVTLTSDKINTSTNPHYLDANTYTEFQFSAPVYIQPGVLYAFMVQSSSSDYNLYYGQQNQLAIASSAKALPTDVDPSKPTKIGQAPYVGALFESQNSITWTADQTKDLMFVLDKCVFDITQTPTIPFVTPYQLPYRKMIKTDIQHKLSANLIPNVYSYYSGPLAVDAINVTTTDFVPTATNLGYTYNSTLLNGQTQTSAVSVTPGKYGMPTSDNIYLNDGLGQRLLTPYSNNSFTLTATLISYDANVSPIISDDAVSLYALTYHINNLGLQTRNIDILNGGTGYSNSGTIQVVSAVSGTSNTNDLLTTDVAVLGYTANAAGSITSVYVQSPGSGYLQTPTITLTGAGGANAVFNVHGETSPIGGNGLAKYYTRKVVMVPGNDAGDMRVYYSAYKPKGTEVYIYYRILSSSDSSKFEDQNWQLMTQVNNIGTYSTDRKNIIEFEWAPGTNNQANNLISYKSTNGLTYNNFIQFAIKVVLVTNDHTNVPFLTDIRAIALPSGTGI